MADPIPLSLQRGFWNDWNASNREQRTDRVSIRQTQVVEAWLESLDRHDLKLLEIGCGAGWLCPKLTRFGQVTATDLSDEVLERAKARTPVVDFIAGDFMALDLGDQSFDVAISLEVLSHIADQRAFIQKLAGHLAPGGHLMLATQNRFVLRYLNRVPPPAPGQLRRWVNRRELRDLLRPDFDVIDLFTVTPRIGWGFAGPLQPLKKLARRVLGRGSSASGKTVDSREPVSTRSPGLSLGPLEKLGLGWTLMVRARKRSAG